MLVVEIFIPFLVVTLYRITLILLHDYQRHIERSRLAIFSDFSGFFWGYRQILEVRRYQNISYQKSARINNSQIIQYIIFSHLEVTKLV